MVGGKPRRRPVRTLVALAATCVAGCGSADLLPYPPRPGVPVADTIVLDNHWHTALIFCADDLPQSLTGVSFNPENRRYVMIGWGDEGFFRAQRITPALVAQALFFSRGSVMLVVAFDTPPESTFFENVNIYRIPTSRAGLDRTIKAAVAGFARDADGQLIDAGPGIDGGRFFAGRGRYAFYHTCNQWTADALAAGGVPVSALSATTAGGLAFQLRQLAGVRRNGRPVPTPTAPDAVSLRLARGGRP